MMEKHLNLHMKNRNLPNFGTKYVKSKLVCASASEKDGRLQQRGRAALAGR